MNQKWVKQWRPVSPAVYYGTLPRHALLEAAGQRGELHQPSYLTLRATNASIAAARPAMMVCTCGRASMNCM
jgi:hypothetical protein